MERGVHPLVEPATQAAPGAWKICAGLFLVSLIPLLLLGLYSHRSAASAADRLIRANNLAAATLTREIVEREFSYRVGALRSLAGNPDMVAAMHRRDEEAVRNRLQSLVLSHPRVVRAFVTNAEGLLWSDYPKAPESLGRNFAFRDWFAGVSASWQPYVSDVYRRHAEPKLLLVAVAVPVRDPATGEVLGAAVCQVTLDDLTKLFKQVTLGAKGLVYLVDASGTIAAHPGLDLQAREYREYAEAAPVRRVPEAGAGGLVYLDPLASENMLAAALPCSIQGRRWMVVAQQPVKEAFAPVRLLAMQITGAGLVVALVTGMLFLGLGVYHNRVRGLNARLERMNRDLAAENRERRCAEEALAKNNAELERRVEERTRELRRKDEQLMQAQKMEAVGRLAGGIAHDFNNLLTIITGYGEVLLESLPGDDRRREKMELIVKAGERAGSLTRQLLAFSRRQVMQPQVLDLNSVVQGMEQMLRRLIGEDLDLILKLKPGLDPVLFDPGQAEQILLNLAINARDAMPTGGRLTVETANVELDGGYVRTHAEARTGPHVMLAVTDTGEGMDHETLARIFEPFYTTKQLGRGTGLGLSTVYGIVKQCGGNIWVYSEPGHGTTFKVYIPRAEDPQAFAARPREEPAPSAGKETVLVVEDEDGVRAFIGEVLSSAGYTVLAAADAADATRLCEAHEGDIHLLLTDVVLPGSGGRRLAESLARLRPGMRVAYMSGYTDNAIVHHGVLDPGTAFLEKPIRANTLLRKMREFLV